MKECGFVRDALPEYVTGRPLSERERIAGHLSRCSRCADARKEMEAVFALLGSALDPPKSEFGEANTRLALQTAFGPGPNRSSERDRKRENLRLGMSAVFSLASMAAFTGIGLLVEKTPYFTVVASWLKLPPLSPSRPLSSLSLWDGQPIFQGHLPWVWLALFLALGGLVVILPILFLQTPSAARRRRLKREA